MEMLDRYVIEVGKHLPRKNRVDIEREIRSSLQDMLEDRSRETGQPVDEAMLVDVLKAYGAPETVSATYLPERYLIGPRLYPFFTMVLKIVFTVFTSVAAIGLAMELARTTGGFPALAAVFGKTLLNYVQGIVAALGYMVLAFFLLERFLPEKEFTSFRDEKEPWEPASLMKEPDPDTVKPWEPVLSITFIAIVMALFNIFPQVIGTVFTQDGAKPMFVLTEAFYRALPWLNIVWGLEIVLHLLVLRGQRWTPRLRLGSIAIQLAGVVIAAVMLAGPELVHIIADTVQGVPFPAERVEFAVNSAVRIGLGIAIVASIAEIIQFAYRMITRQSALLKLKS